MPKLKLEDLAELREKARKSTSLRDGAARVRVTIHMGTCGIAAGARKIVEAAARACAVVSPWPRSRSSGKPR
jgi:NADP-reducing hydrogenase subunit HndB